MITYLDHAASTPMREEAIEAMLPYLREQYANPSGSHRFARQARHAVDDARDRVAAVLGCRPNDVVFTGCGTESDNMAITGAVQRLAGRPVCCAIEHPAVLDVVEHHDGIVVGVDAAGKVDLDALADRLDRVVADGVVAGGVVAGGRVAGGATVSIVSVMTVNNEVGSINDLAAVARIVHRHAPGALVHTDAVQAATWLDLRTVTPHVDLLSLSAHKFGGPKGVGVLVENGGPKVDPLIIGGGQERERRSGTHNTAGIVAASIALELTDAERDTELVRIADLRDRLVGGITSRLDGVHETLAPEDKVAGSAHLCIEGIESESLLYLLDEADVCASAASACASGAMEPSHVLAAMGVPRERALGALRMTLGHESSIADVDRGVEAVVHAVTTLRDRSTLRARSEPRTAAPVGSRIS